MNKEINFQLAMISCMILFTFLCKSDTFFVVYTPSLIAHPQKLNTQSENSRAKQKNHIESKLEIINIEEGLDFITGYVSIDSSNFDVFILKISPNNFNLKIGGLNPETLSGYSLYGYINRYGGVGAVTGGFRSNQGLPIGLVIENGKIVNRLNKNSTLLSGILTIKNNRVNIIKRADYDNSRGVDYALQSGPIIVEKGGKNGIHKSERNTRTAATRCFLGIDRNDSILMGITTPVHLYNLAEFLINRESGLSCDVAINLEGGREGLLIKTNHYERAFRYVQNKRPDAIILVRR